MASKVPVRSSTVAKGGDAANDPQKPLSATLLQEFQNLKDKFKNDDDVQEKGEKLLNCHYLLTSSHFTRDVTDHGY